MNSFYAYLRILLCLFPAFCYAQAMDFSGTGADKYLEAIRICKEGVYNFNSQQLSIQRVYLIKKAGDNCNVYYANSTVPNVVFFVTYTKEYLQGIPENLLSNTKESPFTPNKGFMILGILSGLSSFTNTQTCVDDAQNFYLILSQGKVPQCNFKSVVPPISPPKN